MSHFIILFYLTVEAANYEIKNKQKTRKQSSATSCDKCRLKLSSIRSLKRHQERFHSNSEISCDLSPQSFAEKSLLTLHLEQDHANLESTESQEFNHESTAKQDFEVLHSTETGSDYDLSHYEQLFGMDDEAENSRSVNSEADCFEINYLADDDNSEKEPEKTEFVVFDEGGTVNADPHALAVPTFEEAIMYIDLLSTYCANKVSEGTTLVQILKTMIEEQKCERSNVHEKLPAISSAMNHCQTAPDPLKVEDL